MVSGNFTIILEKNIKMLKDEKSFMQIPSTQWDLGRSAVGYDALQGNHFIWIMVMGIHFGNVPKINSKSFKQIVGINWKKKLFKHRVPKRGQHWFFMPYKVTTFYAFW